jgi:hypothetical protein
MLENSTDSSGSLHPINPSLEYILAIRTTLLPYRYFFAARSQRPAISFTPCRTLRKLRPMDCTTSFYPGNPVLLVDVMSPGISPVRQSLFSGLCLRVFPATPLYPRHHHAVRVFRTVSLAGLFFAGEGGETCQVLPGVFCKTPQCNFIRVSLVVHEYQSHDKGIKAGRAAGESEK